MPSADKKSPLLFCSDWVESQLITDCSPEVFSNWKFDRSERLTAFDARRSDDSSSLDVFASVSIAVLANCFLCLYEFHSKNCTCSFSYDKILNFFSTESPCARVEIFSIPIPNTFDALDFGVSFVSFWCELMTYIFFGGRPYGVPFEQLLTSGRRFRLMASDVRYPTILYCQLVLPLNLSNQRLFTMFFRWWPLRPDFIVDFLMFVVFECNIWSSDGIFNVTLL